MVRDQTANPPSLPVVLFVGFASPEFALQCRLVAARARLHLIECAVGDASTAALGCHPLVILLTHEIYAGDPSKFDALASDAGAKLVRIESLDAEPADLGSVLSAAAFQARQMRGDRPSPASARSSAPNTERSEGSTAYKLLDLAEDLILQLSEHPAAEAAQLAEEAVEFAAVFRRWLRQGPVDDEDRVATARRFFVLYRSAAEYLSPSAWSLAPKAEGAPGSSEPPPSKEEYHRCAGAAVEQLVKDTSLRGSLSERGYAPLLAWAADRAPAVAANLGMEVDGWDGVILVASLLSRVVRASVRAAGVGDAAGLVAVLEACPRCILDRDLAIAVLSRLPLDADADGNAIAIAAVLRSVAPFDPTERR